MKKLFLSLLIGLHCLSYAQTVDSQASSSTTNEPANSIKKGAWTVELSSGFRSEIFMSSSFVYNQIDVKSGKQLSTPQIEAAVWYGLTNYFAVESGLAYVKYNTNWTHGFNSIPKHKLYSALQIPLRVRFSVPIKNNFHFFSTTGVVVQLPLQGQTSNRRKDNVPYIYFSGDMSSDENTQIAYDLATLSPTYGINILLNAKIGFIYQFDFGLGISIFGEYYKGTRRMATVSAVYTEAYSEIYGNYGNKSKANYITKGDYWNTGIGVSYSF